MADPNNPSLRRKIADAGRYVAGKTAAGFDKAAGLSRKLAGQAPSAMGAAANTVKDVAGAAADKAGPAIRNTVNVASSTAGAAANTAREAASAAGNSAAGQRAAELGRAFSQNRIRPAADAVRSAVSRGLDAAAGIQPPPQPPKPDGSGFQPRGVNGQPVRLTGARNTPPSAGTVGGTPPSAAPAAPSAASRFLPSAGTVGRGLARGAAALGAVKELNDVRLVANDANTSKTDVLTQAAEGAGKWGSAGAGAGLGATVLAPAGPVAAAVGGIAGGIAGYVGGEKLIEQGRRALGVNPDSPLEQLQARDQAAAAAAEPQITFLEGRPGEQAPPVRPLAPEDTPTGNFIATLDANGNEVGRRALTQGQLDTARAEEAQRAALSRSPLDYYGAMPGREDGYAMAGPGLSRAYDPTSWYRQGRSDATAVTRGGTEERALLELAANMATDPRLRGRPGARAAIIQGIMGQLGAGNDQSLQAARAAAEAGMMNQDAGNARSLTEQQRRGARLRDEYIQAGADRIALLQEEGANLRTLYGALGRRGEGNESDPNKFVEERVEAYSDVKDGDGNPRYTPEEQLALGAIAGNNAGIVGTDAQNAASAEATRDFVKALNNDRWFAGDLSATDPETGVENLADLRGLSRRDARFYDFWRGPQDAFSEGAQVYTYIDPITGEERSDLVTRADIQEASGGRYNTLDVPNRIIDGVSQRRNRQEAGR